MLPTKYKLSFTAASLALNESVKLAELYQHTPDWTQVKRDSIENNLLQSRTNSRNTRILHELILRLRSLDAEQLTLLVQGSLPEQKYLLWFAICKSYPFIREFAVQVLNEKYLSRAMHLTELDYDAFFKHQADWHPELEKITDSTRKKIKQVVLLTIRQAELVSDDTRILPALLSPRLIQVLTPDAPMSFRIFPVEPIDVQG